MIADTVRMSAYSRALERAIRPGALVADIGTGTGIIALLACQYGAGRVFAIEPESVIQVAREVAAANGFADRIEFLHAPSSEVELPGRVDVMVSDLRGVLPLAERHLPNIADARARFLAPGGAQIPQRDTLWAAPVEAPEVYAQYASPGPSDGFGLNLDAARRFACNSFRKVYLSAGQLLAGPACWGALDYGAIATPDVSAELRWNVSRAGTAHGFAAWFDTVLFGDIGFSSGPGAPQAIYGQAFFPFLESVAVAPGDAIELGLRADLVGSDYVWSWKTRIGGAAAKAEFRQSTFFGAPLTPEQLRKLAPGRSPELSEEGRMDFFILGLLHSGVSLEEAARRVAEKFPKRFVSEDAARTRVSDLALRYTR
jgi:protein arginine N-methyltransferase 1